MMDENEIASAKLLENFRDGRWMDSAVYWELYINISWTTKILGDSKFVETIDYS